MANDKLVTLPPATLPMNPVVVDVVKISLDVLNVEYLKALADELYRICIVSVESMAVEIKTGDAAKVDGLFL